MKKRVLTLTLAITLLLSCTVFAKGSPNKPTLLYGNSKLINPDAIEVCNGYATHDMVSSGWGTVYIGTYPDTSNCLLYARSCWQCSRCNYVLITEGNPLLHQPIGRYAGYSCSYPINGYGCTMWTDSYDSCSSTSMPYFSFRHLK